MPYIEKSIVMNEYLEHNPSEFLKSQVFEVYSFSHKCHVNCIWTGFIEMKSGSIVIYLVKYSGNNFKSSLRCCEKSNSGNISFLFKYCLPEAFHKFRLAFSQPNHIQQIDSKHWFPKWQKSNLG